MGGWVDGDKFGPSNFLNLEYVKTYIMKLWNIYKKFVNNIFMGLKFREQVGGPDKKNQKHPLGGIFFKSV